LQRRYDAEEISADKIRLEMAALRAFYDVLLATGAYPSNPARAVRSIARDPRLPRPMPMADVNQLFAAIAVDHWQDRAMVGLFLNALRNVEVCRLTTDAVRYDAEQTTLVLRVVGKGNKLRDVPLNPATSVVL